MNIDRRALQRRHQLRQSVPPEILVEHRHGYWRHQEYPFWVGGAATTIDSLTYVLRGQKIRLDPVVLMYTTKVEFFTTVDFSGAGDTFSMKVDLGSVEIEEIFTDTYVHGLICLDVSQHFILFFKQFQVVDADLSIKVSNAASRVAVYGVGLRFTLWERDTFGDYAKPTSRLLTNPFLSQKVYIQKADKASDEFQYLSGLKV